MAKNGYKKPSAYIERLNMNRLRGRMLRLPPPKGKNREILFIYGQNTNLEQMFPLAADLNKYGGITMPDLPGFGGMQNFYRLGDKPTIDNLADYLAAFVKLFYKRRRVTIIGMGFGFAVVTRMLQKCPDLSSKVNLLISLDGYSRYDDFNLRSPSRLALKLSSGILTWRLPAITAQKLALRPIVIKTIYSLKRRPESKTAIKHMDEQQKHVIELWRKNDLRTYMAANLAKLKLDLCSQQVNLPLKHITTGLKKLNNELVEQHLSVIYQKVDVLEPSKSKTKNSNDLGSLIPGVLRRQLARKV